MGLIAALLVALVAALHTAFLLLEMVLWQRPVGRRVFGLSEEQARATATLAANQGLYNGFLVAGLVWGLLLGAEGRAVTIFFLSCVVAAGVFGALTVNRRILLVQALPGAVALLAVLATPPA